MNMDKAEKRRFLVQLANFHKGFVRYKELAMAEKALERKKAILPNEQRTELQTLNSKLPYKYGRLQAVIQEYGGPAEVLLEGGNYKCEAFTAAFSYTQFSPEALNVVMDTAIAAINIARGKLKEIVVSGHLPQETVYPSGTPYTAYKDIKDILAKATRKLVIVDPYVDSTLRWSPSLGQDRGYVKIGSRYPQGIRC